MYIKALMPCIACISSLAQRARAIYCYTRHAHLDINALLVKYNMDTTWNVGSNNPVPYRRLNVGTHSEQCRYTYRV